MTLSYHGIRAAGNPGDQGGNPAVLRRAIGVCHHGPMAQLKEPTVIAHRGASWWAPEETAPSFLLARELQEEAERTALEGELQRRKGKKKMKILIWISWTF